MLFRDFEGLLCNILLVLGLLVLTSFIPIFSSLRLKLRRKKVVIILGIVSALPVIASIVFRFMYNGLYSLKDDAIFGGAKLEEILNTYTVLFIVCLVIGTVMCLISYIIMYLDMKDKGLMIYDGFSLYQVGKDLYAMNITIFVVMFIISLFPLVSYNVIAVNDTTTRRQGMNIISLIINGDLSYMIVGVIILVSCTAGALINLMRKDAVKLQPVNVLFETLIMVSLNIIPVITNSNACRLGEQSVSDIFTQNGVVVDIYLDFGYYFMTAVALIFSILTIFVIVGVTCREHKPVSLKSTNEI